MSPACLMRAHRINDMTSARTWANVPHRSGMSWGDNGSGHWGISCSWAPRGKYPRSKR